MLTVFHSILLSYFHNDLNKVVIINSYFIEEKGGLAWLTNFSKIL